MTRQPGATSSGESAVDGEDSIAALLVPRDPSSGAAIASALESHGDRLAIEVAETADDAVERLDPNRFDCVVCANEPSDGDPFALLSTARDAYPRVPYVLYGTDLPPTEVAAALEAGVTDVHRIDRGDEALLAARIEAAVEHREASSGLVERVRRLETLVENLPGIVYQCRADGDWPMEYVGGGCEELTGYPGAAIEAGEVGWEEDVLHPEDRDWAVDAVREEIETEGSFALTYRIVTAAGTTKWVWERGRRIDPESGTSPYIEGFITDVTDRRERESQLQVISHLLRHNLRNDMTVVRGYAQMLEAETDKFGDEANVIVERIDDLLTTVDKTQPIVDVLTNPRDRAVVDADDALDRAVASVETRHPEATVDTRGDPAGRVVAIPELERAFTELLENAVVHNDRERPSVSVDVARDAETVAVHIADQGPPIPEMELDVLTGERPPEPLYHGTGLGLWLVEWIVRRSGGSLSFDENEPRGNVVTIELPLWDGET